MIDFRPVMDDGYKISYTSPQGEVWVLHSPDRGMNRQRRLALQPDGFTGSRIKRSLADRESVTRMGARPAGWRVPVASGSLEVAALGSAQEAGANLRDWERSWSDVEPLGKITVAGVGGGSASLPVRLAEMSDFGHDPFRRRGMRVTVDWEAPVGPWRGTPLPFTGAASVLVPGDLPPSVRLLWDGTATSFVLPTGQTVTLPVVREDGLPSPWPRAVSLDRGMQGHVTVASSGATDGASWARLRGSVFGVTLEPYAPSSWVLGEGLTLEVTPHYLSPWR